MLGDDVELAPVAVDGGGTKGTTNEREVDLGSAVVPFEAEGPSAEESAVLGDVGAGAAALAGLPSQLKKLATREIKPVPLSEELGVDWLS